MTCRPVPVDGADATALFRAYLTELVDRYYGRPMPAERVDEAIADHAGDDLAVLLIAYRDAVPVGCVGMRLLEPGTGEATRMGEVTRMYVVPGARRLGVGMIMLDNLEQHAKLLGLDALRLDTRDDLIEARALYARQGFAEIPAYKVDEYADHFFEKRLG